MRWTLEVLESSNLVGVAPNVGDDGAEATLMVTGWLVEGGGVMDHGGKKSKKPNLGLRGKQMDLLEREMIITLKICCEER